MKKLFTLFIVAFFISNLLYSQSLTLMFPSGGEKFMRNVQAPHNIEWTQSGVVNVKIEFSNNSGTDWVTIEDSYPADSLYYDWLSADLLSDECIIKISDADNITLTSQSSIFSIVEQQIFYAKWETSMGNFRAELRGDIVPVTTQNFMNLSYKNFYTDLIFHRVISNFMIQDGCPLGTGYGDPGYEFDDEFDIRLRHDFPGVLSMANGGENTNGSQYFITVAPTTWLDDVHSIYGRVIDSMDIVFDISHVDTDANDKPIVDVDIYTITIDDFLPVLDITFPLNGSSLIEETDLEITWDSEFYADLRIELSNDNGITWEILEDSIPAYYQKFAWTTPSILSENYKIKLINLRDESDSVVSNFEIRNKPAKFDRIECYQNVVPASENPENYFKAGEKFRFKVKVLNDYSETLTGLNAIVTSENEFVTFNNNALTFGNVNAGEYVWSDQEVEVFISETLPSKYDYSFQIDLSDDNVIDDPWSSKFSIPLVVKGMFGTVDDDSNPDSYGNDNNIIEAGETIELKVTLKNNSYHYLYDTYSQLTTTQNYINIWDNIEGVSGTVYDSTAYNSIINPNSAVANPLTDFVFDYNANGTYYIELPMIVYSYIYEPKGLTFEDGGILIKYNIPVILNPSYPVNIEEVEISNNLEFKIYPNPAKDYFEIVLQNSKNIQNINIEVIDLLGKIVYQINNENVKDNFIINANFTPGMYIIKLTDNRNFSNYRLINIIK
jgi:cyclophilin family peptidyl-prolyl cis-trans isomerase